MSAGAGGSFQPAGPVAETMADLWWLMLALGTAVFVLFGVLLWRGLRRNGQQDVDSHGTAAGDPERGVGAWLVGGGVVLPVVVIGLVFAATITAMRATPTGAESDTLVVEVIGHQWWWEVHYPAQDVVTANEIHIPAGEPVTFRLTSADVIHSFWVPRLGGKMDLLPEDVNTLVLQADEPGRYSGDCAEFCGLQHALMGITVVAHDRAEFDAWATEQAQAPTTPSGAAATRGREVFRSADCTRCHTLGGRGGDDDVPAPDLTHLADRLTLAAGVLENTPENLRRFIEDPQGFKPGIEMEATELTDDELDDLVAYLQGLS